MTVTLPIPSNIFTSDLSLYHDSRWIPQQMDISVNHLTRLYHFATDGFSTFDCSREIQALMEVLEVIPEEAPVTAEVSSKRQQI